MERLIWTGLDESQFRRYKSWINKTSPGICGTYCAAVLTHYTVLQDTGHWMSKQQLLNAFETVVDDYHLHEGTFFWNVAAGLNSVFNFNHYRAKTGLIPDKEVPDLIDRYQQPVIVGTLAALGSPYKNHWLLVYAYAYDNENQLFFKAYDNHGNYKAVIPAKHTNAYVYLEAIAPSEATARHSNAAETDDNIAIKPNLARRRFLEKQAKEEAEHQQKLIFGKEWDEWKDMII
ncbi:dihydrolipoamide dehydrogenase [Aerococcus agrisoli]|uniref:Dihydrolipoamide dehydrogenase n=1 Tax=Aerococcus agrisoli TaxID=2487350 RepID=A0A3N4GAE9_9LACT|nr:dihydrolipoamide dehydrogenase [Aerococcus agrisoli]RPA55530.1 dihydrolipoamide dehydrogenase [Aerococcus agrisoli]